MSFARDTMLIFRRQMRLSLRNPAWVIIGLVQPILYLAFFGPLFARVFDSGLIGGAHNSYAYFVPGLLIQLGLFGAAFVGFTIISDWRVGVAFGLRAPLPGVLIGLAFIAVVAVSLAAVSYTVGLLTKSEDVLAPALNMVMVPLMLLSGIMLPLVLGPGWLQAVGRATPFRYIIDAMRDGYAGHYLNAVMLEGVAVSIGLAVVCLWLAGRVFIRENA